MFEEEIGLIQDQISRALEKVGAPASGPIEFAPIPFSGRWGLGSAVCFAAAADEARRGRRGPVPARAAELAELVSAQIRPPTGVEEVRAERGYLNVSFQTPVYATRLVSEIERQGPRYGQGEPRGERLMVEYAQPNTHHSLHVGHARTALLGEAVARIAAFAGFETIRASYPGDIGLGVITCVWAYQKFHLGQEPAGVHERGRWLASIYAEATALLEPRPGETAQETALREAYDLERRDMLRRWSQGDAEVRALWETTRQWSLDELNDILASLDIHMDVFFYESQVEDLARAMVDELIERGIAEDERPSGGPVIVRIDQKLGLTKEKYRTAVILRSDDTTLYLTKDLALARVKFEQYRVDRSIYVVDVRQSLHFQQAFRILELWGFPQAAKCHHLAYGFLTLPEGTISARRGNVVFLKDVLDEAARRAETVIAEKNPELPADQRPQVADQVGRAALAYALLSVDNTKDIVFDWDTALSFDGQTGPYLQNAVVRAGSILRRVEQPTTPARFDHDLSLHEVDLIDLVARFPGVVAQAADLYRPLLVANYAYELARHFHAFYHADSVLQAPTESVRASRWHLTAAVHQTLRNALHLLVIPTPERM